MRSLLPIAAATAVLLVMLSVASSAQKNRTPTPAIEPFQKVLTFILTSGQAVAQGSETFTVPAGRILKLRSIASKTDSVFSGTPNSVVGIINSEIETFVSGAAAIHPLSNASSPLLADLWADDSGTVTVRLWRNTINLDSATVWVVLSGDLY